jgi:hypothetical protein
MSRPLVTLRKNLKTDTFRKGADALAAGFLVSDRSSKIAHYEPYIYTSIV